MAKYRKKPVVVEAVQLRWDTWNEMCEHAGVGRLEDGKPSRCFIGSDEVSRETPLTKDDALGLLIPTLEGVMLAHEGDYVIRGVKGELYPCKPDIFKATYEKVEDNAAST